MMVNVERIMDTTPTQYALAVCFLIIGPAFGIIGALVQWRREANLWFGVVTGAGASWLGWIVACAVAATLFPRYPASGGVSEPIAMLATVPGLVAGAVVLRWLATRRAPTRNTPMPVRVGAAVLAVLGVALAVAFIRWHIGYTTWPARRSLPEQAVVVSEDGLIDTFIGDFRYTMSARMSHGEFLEWMRRLRLRPNGPDRLRFEQGGSEPDQCGAIGEYRDGIGYFESWCS